MSGCVSEIDVTDESRTEENTRSRAQTWREQWVAAIRTPRVRLRRQLSPLRRKKMTPWPSLLSLFLLSRLASLLTGHHLPLLQPSTHSPKENVALEITKGEKFSFRAQPSWSFSAVPPSTCGSLMLTYSLCPIRQHLSSRFFSLLCRVILLNCLILIFPGEW